MSEHTPTPVEVPLSIARRHEEGSASGVSITKVHVPLLITIGLLVAIGSIVSAAVAIWFKSDNHATDKHAHINKDESQAGGGVAYKADVQAINYRLERVVDELRQMHEAYKRQILRCRKCDEGFCCRVVSE